MVNGKRKLYVVMYLNYIKWKIATKDPDQFERDKIYLHNFGFLFIDHVIDVEIENPNI